MNAAIARIREHIFSHTWENFFPHLKDSFFYLYATQYIRYQFSHEPSEMQV